MGGRLSRAGAPRNAPPCTPCTAAPWLPGAPTVLVGNLPAPTSTSKLMCMWGGMIQFTTPGQFTVQMP